MKTIRDAVHGNIKIEDDIVTNIIDHPLMQRLRRIKQVPFIDLIYPSANNTRFEHSLGVYELTREVMKNNEYESKELEIYALIHDLGHYPLAHTLESFFKKRTGMNHEEHLYHLVKTTDLKEKISNCGCDWKKVLKMEKAKVGEIVWGDIGTDRIDYLLRDSYHAGKTLVFDYQRLIDTLILNNRGLFVLEKSLEPAEALLIFRYWMFRTVYHHHTRRIIAKMLERALTEAENNGLVLNNYTLSDDWKFIDAILKYGNSWMERILSRELCKTAYVSKNRELLEMDEQEIAAEMEKKTGVPVLVDIPRNTRFGNVKARVLTEDGIIPLNEISPVVGIINRMWQESWRAYVYCDKQYIPKVKRVAKMILEK
jgi:HD superfamily phosphohydrolase